jgi:hypothetical protein
MDSSRQSFQAALDQFDEVAQSFPAIPVTMAEFRSRQGIALGGLAFLALGADDPEKAREFADRAIENQSAARRLEPANPEFRSFLQAHYTFLAKILDRLGDEAAASQARREAERLTAAP